jgi:uncharacterized membrane protein YkvA (DUF1232 family)
MAASRWGAFRTLFTAVRTATRPGSPSAGERAQAVPRMVRATLSGEYTGTTRTRLLMLAAAAAYVVSPVDLVPEGLLAIFGLADDAMVVSWIAATLVNETESFLAWERGGRAAGPGGGAGSASHRGRGPAYDTTHDTVPGHVVR